MTLLLPAVTIGWLSLAVVAVARMAHRRGGCRVQVLRQGSSPRASRRVPLPHTVVKARRLAVAGAALLGLVAFPALALVTLTGLCVTVVTRTRASRRRARDEVDAELTWVVDALAVAVSSGLNLVLALEVVARRSTGSVAVALRGALRSTAHGTRLADALDDVLVAHGEAWRPLVTVLAHSERYGAPLVEPLNRLAEDLRHRRQRRSEEEARRMPVKLLFPLVVCILPAFGLLTVAPLIAGGLRSLRL